MHATMEVESEPEVMGHPGHVRDMIARFTSLAPLDSPVTSPTSKSEIKPNGIHHDDEEYDVTDNALKHQENSVRSPIIRDITLGKTINNNDKLWSNEIKGDDEKESSDFIIDYRKLLKPVAKRVILETNHVDDVIRNDVHENNGDDSTVVENGSEPSLVSRNSQRSATTASKRTLVSQETSSPHKSHPQSSSEVSPRSSSQPTLLDDTMPATTDSSFDSSIDTTPKTPSYMKISCALSGYNRYYTSPKQEAKLKVIKLSEQNGSHSSLSSSQSDSSEVRSNGDLRPQLKRRDDVEMHENEVEEGMKNGVDSVVNNCEQLVINGSSSRIIQNGADNNQQQHQQQQREHEQMVVVNGGTDKSSEDGGDGHRFVTMATVNLQPSSSPPTTPEVRNLQWEERRPDLKSAVSTPSPSKDGHYYFPVLDREVTRIQALCAQCTKDLEDNNLPEDVSGKIRATIGKSNLLVNKKFQQFRGLCDRNINQSQDEQFSTTVADLAGFWDMVSIQISDIDTMFRDIENMRRSDWKITKAKSPVKPAAVKSGKTNRPSSATPSKTVKSAKAEEAAKARDEARKRLLAAKRAGRQRKASQSDKEEIEIFVAE